MLNLQVKGLTQLQKDVGAYDRKSKKALELAIRVEGFRQLRVLRDEIKKGRPGGRPYNDPLSQIARRTKTGRMKKNQIPLYRVARLLRYNVEYKNRDINLSFGFVARRGGRLSSAWKALLLKHQEGIDILYSGSRRALGRRMARIGGRLKKRGDPDAKFFFLRKRTGRRIGIPKRPMIEPFWRAHKNEARVNIAKNFRRKMRGERI